MRGFLFCFYLPWNISQDFCPSAYSLPFKSCQNSSKFKLTLFAAVYGLFLSVKILTSSLYHSIILRHLFSVGFYYWFVLGFLSNGEKLKFEINNGGTSGYLWAGCNEYVDSRRVWRHTDCLCIYQTADKPWYYWSKLGGISKLWTSSEFL